jgi:hypothetical protein
METKKSLCSFSVPQAWQRAFLQQGYVLDWPPSFSNLNFSDAPNQIFTTLERCTSFDSFSIYVYPSAFLLCLPSSSEDCGSRISHFCIHSLIDAVEQIWIIPVHRRSPVRLKVLYRATTTLGISTPLPLISATTSTSAMEHLRKGQSARMSDAWAFPTTKVIHVSALFHKLGLGESSTNLVSFLGYPGT